MPYEDVTDWRELLKLIIQEPGIRKRIDSEIGRQAVNIKRWINGKAEPRVQNLKQLLNVIPEYREQMIELLDDEYADEFYSDYVDATRDIPATFIASVLSARARTHREIRYWSLCRLIIEQAIGQLDPDRLGMAITVVRCMKSEKFAYIRTLRESAATGTPPWPGNLDQQSMFLGAESLAGLCVSSCREVQNNDIRSNTNLLPAHQVEFELSAAAAPILLSGKCAGCMLISSTQPDFFLSQQRLTLIRNYANLLALAFEPAEFYESSDIRLEVMPLHAIQRGYFSDFHRRTLEIVAETKRTPQQAEQQLLEDLEETLLEAQRKKQAAPA
jgi:GAF domain-containing protein